MVHILWNKDEFHTVLLSLISVTHDQPCYENLKWKVPEVNNSTVLNCVLFWGAWWNFTPHCSNCLRTWSIPLFSVFTLHMPPTCQSLSDHISYQVDFSSVSQYLYKMFGTFWIFGGPSEVLGEIYSGGESTKYGLSLLGPNSRGITIKVLQKNEVIKMT